MTLILQCDKLNIIFKGKYVGFDFYPLGNDWDNMCDKECDTC